MSVFVIQIAAINIAIIKGSIDAHKRFLLTTNVLTRFSTLEIARVYWCVRVMIPEQWDTLQITVGYGIH